MSYLVKYMVKNGLCYNSMFCIGVFINIIVSFINLYMNNTDIFEQSNKLVLCWFLPTILYKINLVKQYHNRYAFVIASLFSNDI
jgi:hypothetical protein